MPHPSNPLNKIDRKLSLVTRPSNVSDPTSPRSAHPIDSPDRLEAHSVRHYSVRVAWKHSKLTNTQDTLHQAKSHYRHENRAADTQAAQDADTDTFESEEVDLADLRRTLEKMQQREAHFVQRNGRKLHRHPANAVPYPRSYDREVVDQ